MNRSRIVICDGTLASEECLLGEISSWIQEVRKDPSLLRHSLRVIVPSLSLKNHLCASLVRRLGMGLAGVRIQTMQSLAVELLENSGIRPPRGYHLIGILIRRRASEEDFLKEELGHIVDGMGALVGTLVDLIEAGLQEGHLEPVDELLCSMRDQGRASRAIMRARAILRVAGRLIQDTRLWDVGLKSASLLRAQEVLTAHGPEAIDQCPIIIYGFADATGVACDFLETLLRFSDATVIMDHPLTPGEWTQTDPGKAFTYRLLKRLSTHVHSVEEFRKGFRPEGVTVFKAPGSYAECRQVALSIQWLIRNGVRPESIGVVARDLQPYITPLRQNFINYGIPFSGISARRPKAHVDRLLEELVELLRLTEECFTEIWLDLVDKEACGKCSITSSQLLLALRSMGAGRLGEVATLGVEAMEETHKKGYPLPMRISTEDADDESLLPRRMIPWEALRELRGKALSLVSLLKQWESIEAPVVRHVEIARSLVRDHLLWSDDNPALGFFDEILVSMQEDIPESFPLRKDEFLILFESILMERQEGSIGGNGGGVQVLDAMEARSRTFDHLFLIGVNQDLFPRLIREDPLLPDWIRTGLSSLLPDVPIKARGYEEERYLFAQLLSSSPHVTISWQSSDDDGRAKSPSPFVHKLILSTGLEPLKAGRAPSEPLESLCPSTLRPIHEWGILAGLAGRRDLLGPIIEAALKSAFGDATPWPCPEAAMGRLAVLQEMDPDLSTKEGATTAAQLGPYLGVVGPATGDVSLRSGDLYITTLEAMASCPWRTFLTHVLRIEQARDPLAEIPALGPWLVGKVVHGVLEQLVTRSIGPEMRRTVEEARSRMPILIKWPEEQELQVIVEEVSERILREEGFGTPGWARLMVQKVRPYLEVARRTEWPSGDKAVPVLAAEVEGSLEVQLEKNPRKLRFKADRADMTSEGLVFTEYKIGKPISKDIKEDSRRKKLLQAILRGERLQVASYVLSCEGQQGAMGRYLFLKPDIPDHCRVFQINSRDADLLEAFDRSARVILQAWDQGVFFPRLVDPKGEKEPPQCAWCEVSLACSRGESGVRARLIRWASRAYLEERRGTLEETFLALWRLGINESQE